jgi:hypothetical protein
MGYKPTTVWGGTSCMIGVVNDDSYRGIIPETQEFVQLAPLEMSCYTLKLLNISALGSIFFGVGE